MEAAPLSVVRCLLSALRSPMSGVSDLHATAAGARHLTPDTWRLVPDQKEAAR